ncbi:hypothetical protein BGW36DRAFT_429908 [Talaromyces proteolyticus]|uniref:Uncharacterized protein n=1 Tax=Talaromyces proteolyticus TaxID=1131652 RepID=A0AAD4PY02_9EURO|nr:uncharacterized protein BGW36DRAFT_429908 [Talaromyces proteolyticus]KAH8693879.1 hypothetical protein BGW36DRAFT_429908 [Talaromyces proteolyticus]
MASMIMFDEFIDTELSSNTMRIMEFSTSAFLKVVAMGLGQYLFFKVIYNVFFHPLRNYPSP